MNSVNKVEAGGTQGGHFVHSTVNNPIFNIGQSDASMAGDVDLGYLDSEPQGSFGQPDATMDGARDLDVMEEVGVAVVGHEDHAEATPHTPHGT